MGRARTKRRAAAREQGAVKIDWRAIDRLRVPCRCPVCQKVTRWPAYYLIRQWSYECILEANAPKDKDSYEGRVSTSSSPTAWALQHARLTGARLDRGCELEPESEEALKREIARYGK